jgi:drug/metabolite transporter (DMT)-like permease
MGVVVALSLLAATCFATASVLQHHGARAARRRAPLHPGLVAELLTRPGWVLGIGAQLLGVGLHLWAVNRGPLSLVQPLLAVGLVIALGLQRLHGRHVPRPALVASGFVVAGLVIFLAAQPERAPGGAADTRSWLPGLCLAGALLAATLGAGLCARGGARGVFLGAAAGVLMATSAAIGKAWGAVLVNEGVSALLAGWQLWAAVGCGLAGALLSQGAFQAGPLGGTLAAMMAIDPVIGVALGMVVYHEPFADGDGVPARVLGLAIALSGVVALARGQRETSSDVGWDRRLSVGASGSPRRGG